MTTSTHSKSKRSFLNQVLKNNQQGMTLIEIMIAITLLAIMGTFVAGRIFKTLEEGQIKSAKIQMKGLEAQLKEFRRKCGFFPSTEQGLEVLLEEPTTGRKCKNYPRDGFLDGDSIPADPWENDYVYSYEGRKVNIISYGPDGEEGGLDGEESDDISLRESKKKSE